MPETCLDEHMNSLFKMVFEFWSSMDADNKPTFYTFTSHTMWHFSITDMASNAAIPFA